MSTSDRLAPTVLLPNAALMPAPPKMSWLTATLVPLVSNTLWAVRLSMNMSPLTESTPAMSALMMPRKRVSLSSRLTM